MCGIHHMPPSSWPGLYLYLYATHRLSRFSLFMSYITCGILGECCQTRKSSSLAAKDGKITLRGFSRGSRDISVLLCAEVFTGMTCLSGFSISCQHTIKWEVYGIHSMLMTQEQRICCVSEGWRGTRIETDTGGRVVILVNLLVT